MRQYLYLWLIRRLAAFVILSIPFFVFFCYANDRHRAAISFGFTIYGTSFALFTYLSQLQTKRREKSDEFFNKWNSDTELRSVSSNILRLHATHPDSIEEFVGRKNLLDLLNFFEHVCGAILINAADEVTLKQYFSPSLEAVYQVAEPFIIRLRRDRSNPYLFQSFEQVAKRWGRR